MPCAVVIAWPVILGQPAIQVGLREIPIVIREVDDNEIIEIALIENIQRKDLTAFEESEASTASRGEPSPYSRPNSNSPFACSEPSRILSPRTAPNTPGRATLRDSVN